LNIIDEYNRLLQNPDMEFVPKTYIFAAKAAPGYYLAKQIIKLIWSISEELKRNPKINEKLNVIFLEDYRVTLSEYLMPASDISEQISLAGKEASGTGNMKLMLNGAITLGTMDGANVEIFEAVGAENIITFGMTKNEVLAKLPTYRPEDYFNASCVIQAAVNRLYAGINGSAFEELANSLKHTDPFMVLADFDAYQAAQKYVSECYSDQTKWSKMSLENIAAAGIFSADRAVDDYARDIWGLSR
jgi:starch phosphorylase